MHHVRHRLPTLASLALTGLLTTLAPCAVAATLAVGPGEAYSRVADAIAAAQDGDTVLIAPGTYRGDVAVITQPRLTLRARGPGVRLQADGRSAEGKAILVVRGSEVLIEGLHFSGARVPSLNGAGIRFERGQLTVRGCSFTDNENGILTSNDGSARLTIEDSLFAQAPNLTTHLDHLLYVGRIAEVTVARSVFREGHTGHLVKSRAARTTLLDNQIDDGPLGSASYEVDLPNGGQALLRGNTIGQSAATQNLAIVSFGAEGQPWPDSALRLEDNTLINRAGPTAPFVRVWAERLPPGTRVDLINNLRQGPGLWAVDAPGTQRGNRPLDNVPPDSPPPAPRPRQTLD